MGEFSEERDFTTDDEPKLKGVKSEAEVRAKLKKAQVKKRVKEIHDIFERYGQYDMLSWLESLEKRVRKLERRE